MKKTKRLKMLIKKRGKTKTRAKKRGGGFGLGLPIFANHSIRSSAIKRKINKYKVPALAVSTVRQHLASYWLNKLRI